MRLPEFFRQLFDFKNNENTKSIICGILKIHNAFILCKCNHKYSCVWDTRLIKKLFIDVKYRYK